MPRSKEEKARYWKIWAARSSNYEKHKAGRRKYYQDNKAKIAKQQNERYHSDPAYKLQKDMRNRLKSALKTQNARKDGKLWELLGCDASTLRRHIEQQFTEGMTWENHGDWHVDHKMPIALFDLHDPEQQRLCFHYSNLQPLWAKDNQSKGGRV